MTYPTNNQAPVVSQGLSTIPAFIFENRDPTENDYNPTMKIYTGWVNTITKAIWYLEATYPSNGFIIAQWRAVGPIVVSEVNPTTSDYLYPIGQTWINTSSMSYWGLVNVTGTTATWEELSSGAATGLLTLTGNTGGSVAGDSSRNINVIGSGGVTVTGTPLNNTLTVALAGGGTAVTSVNVDASTAPGTDPVVPNSTGVMTVTGGQVAAGTTANVIRTDSLAANTYTIEVQRSSAQAGSTLSANGVSHFNSAQFTVDNNGFVSTSAPISINLQVFESSGTYTPTPGMKFCQIEVVGGGGAGGGAEATSGTQVSVGTGGGGGEYALGIYDAATIGVSQTVTIGAGGVGVAGGTGGSGGTSSVGTLITANGGGGGIIATGTSPQVLGTFVINGGTGGTGGSYRTSGADGAYCSGFINTSLPVVFQFSGTGGATLKGFGSIGGYPSSTPTNGGGGGGGNNTTSSPASAGDDGAKGLVIITEYI